MSNLQSARNSNRFFLLREENIFNQTQIFLTRRDYSLLDSQSHLFESELKPPALIICIDRSARIN